MNEIFDKIFCDPLVFLTFVIALATVLYMIFTVLMWLSMKNSLNLSKQIFESTNRPFIGISEFSVQFTDDGLLNPFFRYTNFGAIPAKQLLLKIEYFLNSKSIFTFKIDLPNLFPKDKSMWGNVIKSDFIKNKLTPSDIFSFSMIIEYNGVTKVSHSTKEFYKYDNANNSFIITESIWN